MCSYRSSRQFLFALLAVLLFGADSKAQTEPAQSEEQPSGEVANQQLESDGSSADYRKVTLSGNIVWLAEELEKDSDISTVPEARQRILALKTANGELMPIVEDVRGRAFRTDERLRQMDVELVARRYTNHPLIRILVLYERVGKQKFEIDYWCDVCSIGMFETGPCSCCQDHNRLRKREVERDLGGESEEGVDKEAGG